MLARYQLRENTDYRNTALFTITVNIQTKHFTPNNNVEAVSIDQEIITIVRHREKDGRVNQITYSLRSMIANA